MRKIKKIVICHSRTKAGFTASWHNLVNWHTGVHPDSPFGRTVKQREPLKYVDYHLGIERVGFEYQILWGRPWRIPAEHIGITPDVLWMVWAGDFTDVAPSELMIDKGISVLADLCGILKISPDSIFGHNEVDPRYECPGEKFSMNWIRSLVKSQPVQFTK
jgi:hypothetical protein